MAKVQVFKTSGKLAGQIEIPEQLFSYPLKKHLLYEAVVQYQANQRQGTSATKTRGEVKGSNRKPWRQKGTGRARVGSIRNPLWRKGGVVFGPQPRDYRQGLPRRAKNNALRSALSLRWAEKRLLVLEEVKIAEAKTKEAAKLLESFNLDSALIVDKHENKNLFLGLRNIPRVKAMDSRQISAHDVLTYKWLVLSQRALESLMERIQK